MNAVDVALSGRKKQPLRGGWSTGDGGADLSTSLICYADRHKTAGDEHEQAKSQPVPWRRVTFLACIRFAYEIVTRADSSSVHGLGSLLFDRRDPSAKWVPVTLCGTSI